MKPATFFRYPFGYFLFVLSLRRHKPWKSCAICAGLLQLAVSPIWHHEEFISEFYVPRNKQRKQSIRWFNFFYWATRELPCFRVDCPRAVKDPCVCRSNDGRTTQPSSCDERFISKSSLWATKTTGRIKWRARATSSSIATQTIRRKSLNSFI